MTKQSKTLGTIFSMEEAAEELHISRRALQDLIKLHPHYALNGHRKLFSEADIRALWEAMRTHSLPSASIRKIKRQQAAEAESSLKRLQELLAKPSRDRSKHILK